MYIRRKVFSLLNVNGEEKYFSTTDITLEQREFGRGKSSKNRKARKGYGSKTPQNLSVNGVPGISDGTLITNNSTNRELLKEHSDGRKALEASKQEAQKVLEEGKVLSKDLKSLSKNSGKLANADGLGYTRMDEYGRQKSHQSIDRHAGANDINKLRKESHANVQRLAAAENEIDRLHKAAEKAGEESKKHYQELSAKFDAERGARKAEQTAHNSTKQALSIEQQAKKAAEEAAKKFEAQGQKTAKTLKKTRIGGGVALAGTAALGAGLYARERAKVKKLQK